jgi:hypothetical protein
MKLLDKKEYENNLRELMETPFGGYQQKHTIIQQKPDSKLIHEQPAEKQNTPVSATPLPKIQIINEQPPSPSFYKTGTATLNLTRLGILIGIFGSVFGYLYGTSPYIQSQFHYYLNKLTLLANNQIIFYSLILGFIIAIFGLIFKK